MADPDIGNGKSLDVDFLSLAIQDEAFGEIYQRNGNAVDFKNPKDVQQLTKSILKTRFKLNIELPDDRLCPPVPIRYEYIRWLQRLVDTTSEDYKDTHDHERNVIGIDIGTGATCIYPLLGCTLRPNWRFIATEIDDKSFDYASRNIKANHLNPHIRLRKAQADGPILPIEALQNLEADFVMCNPPFYTSADAMKAASEAKDKPPSAVCTGAPTEMVCPGGDLGFAKRILAESRRLQQQVQWYSCMLGKLSSAQALVSDLKSSGATNWAVTSLQAGHRTKRWVVAWSFASLRPASDVARGDAVAKELLPFPTDFSIQALAAFEGELKARLDAIFKPLKLHWSWTSSSPTTGLCFARANVWSRAARRKQHRGGNNVQQDGNKANSQDDDDDEQAALGVRITVRAAQHRVDLRWLRGHDQVLWESLCGMVRRELIRGFATPKAVAAGTNTTTASPNT